MSQYTLEEFESSGVECDVCGRTFDTQQGLNSHRGHKHPDSITVEAECANCGDTVDITERKSDDSERRFCDHECYGEWLSGDNHHNWNGGKVTLECEFCGDEYERIPSEAEDSNYCSKECMYSDFPNRDFQHTGEDHPMWNGGGVSKECVICGEDYVVNEGVEQERRKTCSIECSAELHSRTQNGQDHPQWRGGVEMINAVRLLLGSDSWDNIAERARERDGRVCQMCGETSDGRRHPVHHIIPINVGGTHFEDNLMTLCPSCHKTAETYIQQFPEFDPILVE